MKWLLAMSSIIYAMSATAGDLLIVQSHVLTQLYGSSIVTHILHEQQALNPKSDIAIEVIHNRTFTFDSSPYSRDSWTKYLSRFVGEHKPKQVLFLGEDPVDLGPDVKVSASGVLSDAEKLNTTALTANFDYDNTRNKLYVINGISKRSQLRAKALIAKVPQLEATEYSVRTEKELRVLLLKLNSEPKGTLLLNVFQLQDEWGDVIDFKRIEDIFMRVNNRHVEVGICTNGFRTEFAIGPTAKEAGFLAITSDKQQPYASSCANLRRLSETYGMDIYLKSMGKFDIVEGGDG